MRYNGPVAIRAGLFTLAAALAFAGAAAGGKPLTISERDNGKRFTIHRGAQGSLRLSHDWRWTEPRVSTRTVTLTQVDYFVDPGFNEWEIHARRRGTAVITARGVPGRRFRVTIVVT